jgi:hypothetical protein
MKAFLSKGTVPCVIPQEISVWSQGAKLGYVVFVDSESKLVRVCVPSEISKKYENLIKSIYGEITKIGKYESKLVGYEFIAPDLEIKIK